MGVGVLAQVAETTSHTGETVLFWIIAPLAVLSALGLVIARKAVHGAMFVAVTMICLAVLYIALEAPFLGVVQVVVYTGAIMMLFLFVLMLVGKESVDSVVEVLRGQRVAAALGGIGLAFLLVAVLGRAFAGVTSVGLVTANTVNGGNVVNLGRVLFTDYLFPFELTSALLISAAVGAMVLAFTERGKQGRLTQRERVEARFRGARSSPLPGPGVFATSNSVATPALLPDGSPAPESRSELLESTARERLDEDVRSVASAGAEPDTRALRARADQDESQA